jgi:hypothetical protein
VGTAVPQPQKRRAAPSGALATATHLRGRGSDTLSPGSPRVPEPSAIHLMPWIEIQRAGVPPPVANREVLAASNLPDHPRSERTERFPNRPWRRDLQPARRRHHFADDGKRRDIPVLEGECTSVARAAALSNPAAGEVGPRDRAQAPAGRARLPRGGCAPTAGRSCWKVAFTSEHLVTQLRDFNASGSLRTARPTARCRPFRSERVSPDTVPYGFFDLR